MWFKSMLTSCSSDVGSIKDYKKQSRITMSRLWTESVTVFAQCAKVQQKRQYMWYVLSSIRVYKSQQCNKNNVTCLQYRPTRK